MLIAWAVVELLLLAQGLLATCTDHAHPSPRQTPGLRGATKKERISNDNDAGGGGGGALMDKEESAPPDLRWGVRRLWRPFKHEDDRKDMQEGAQLLLSLRHLVTHPHAHSFDTAAASLRFEGGASIPPVSPPERREGSASTPEDMAMDEHALPSDAESSTKDDPVSSPLPMMLVVNNQEGVFPSKSLKRQTYHHSRTSRPQTPLILPSNGMLDSDTKTLDHRPSFGHSISPPPPYEQTLDQIKLYQNQILFTLLLLQNCNVSLADRHMLSTRLNLRPQHLRKELARVRQSLCIQTYHPTDSRWTLKPEFKHRVDVDAIIRQLS